MEREMRIYLVRHGETEWNQQMRMQGREDIPLNEHGIRQAEECARAFEKIHVKRIVSSPLERALHTARIIGNHIKVEDILIDEDLTERDFGIYSGCTYEKRDSYKNSDGSDGVETVEQLLSRMNKMIQKYRGGEDIILVSHGAAINAIISIVSKGEIGLGKTWLKNACISLLECSEDKISVIFYNLTAEEFENYP
jgi:uncharacterized phosphatase